MACMHLQTDFAHSSRRKIFNALWLFADIHLFRFFYAFVFFMRSLPYKSALVGSAFLYKTSEELLKVSFDSSLQDDFSKKSLTLFAKY